MFDDEECGHPAIKGIGNAFALQMTRRCVNREAQDDGVSVL